MYDSKPKDKEGEPIEFVVPEAIDTTASKEREGGPLMQQTLPQWIPEGRVAFAAVAVLAILEAILLIIAL